MKKTDVVVFDFDGTLSARDCNMEFGKYCFRHSIRPWLFIPVILFAVLARPFNPRGIWWRQVMRSFLTQKMVTKLAPGFIKQHKRERFGWSFDQVAAERSAGNRVVLISAGPDYLIPKLAGDMNFDAIICSNMEKKKPWKYKFFCYHKNKVAALDAWAHANKITPRVVRSYSDNKSDMPIMSTAELEIWIDPKTGSRK